MRSTVLANRRKARRHAVHIACQVVRERDFRLVSDRILNLSISGLVVATAEPVAPGERLLVSFRLPRTTYWIDTEATVTRISPARRPGDAMPALGLEFDPLPWFSRLMFGFSLLEAPPAPPVTRPGRRSTGKATRALLRAPIAMAAAL